MAIYPRANYKKITAKKRNKMTRYDRVNLHVAVSEASSLFGYFNKAGRPDSHFYVLKNGTVEQYVDTAFNAYADLQGNPTTISIETQGGVKNSESEKWTDKQINALAELFAWVSKTHNIEMKLAKSSMSGENKGLSWHRLGVNGNFPKAPSILAGRLQLGGGLLYSKWGGKACPGSAKILQIPEILKKASGKTTTGSTGSGSSGSTGGSSSSGSYLVRVTANSLNIRSGPGVKEKKVGAIKDKGVYTIIDEKNGWGKLKSGAGWISLHYTVRVSGSSGSGSSGSAGLNIGSKGAKVRALQKGLNTVFPAYSKLVVDDYYGEKTAGVVKEFQKRVGLVADGWCGPVTLAALKKFGITI